MGKKLETMNKLLKKNVCFMWDKEKSKLKQFRQALHAMTIKRNKIIAAMNNLSDHEGGEEMAYLRDELFVSSKEIEDKKTHFIRTFYSSTHCIVQEVTKFQRALTQITNPAIGVENELKL